MKKGRRIAFKDSKYEFSWRMVLTSQKTNLRAKSLIPGDLYLGKLTKNKHAEKRLNFKQLRLGA